MAAVAGEYSHVVGYVGLNAVVVGNRRSVGLLSATVVAAAEAGVATISGQRSEELQVIESTNQKMVNCV